MKFRLGSRGTDRQQKKPVLKFSDWIKTAVAGEYAVEYIFLPNKYPSYSFKWTAQEGRVSMTLPEDKAKEVLRNFGFRRGDVEKELRFVLDGNDYGFTEAKGYTYFRGWGWSIHPPKNDDLDIELT